MVSLSLVSLVNLVRLPLLSFSALPGLVTALASLLWLVSALESPLSLSALPRLVTALESPLALVMTSLPWPSR